MIINIPRILQINTVLNSSATGRITEEIGKQVKNKGWESYIAHSRTNYPSESKLIKIGTTKDFYIHAIVTRLFDRHAFASSNATIQLIKKIDFIKPDIIHLHNVHGYYINIKLLFNYLSKLNIPIVWTLHDCWPLTGHCVHFDNIGCNKWKTACFQCPQKNTYPASIFIDNSRINYLQKKQLFNSIKNLTLVAVSTWLYNIIKQSYLANTPAEIIYNGVDTDTFRNVNSNNVKEKYDLSNKFIILGVANVWSNQKGLKDFLELSKKIDSQMIIVLVGLNYNQIKSLPNNIIGISRTENTKELAELYSAADVLVNASTEETFGLVSVEALACGTPVIVYDSTANPEIIDISTGFVVDKGDIEGIFKAICTIKIAGKAKYRDNCIKRVKDNYNKEEKYAEYIQLYEKLLSAN